jgi:hypothetical protein
VAVKALVPLKGLDGLTIPDGEKLPDFEKPFVEPTRLVLANIGDLVKAFDLLNGCSVLVKVGLAVIVPDLLRILESVSFFVLKSALLLLRDFDEAKDRDLLNSRRLRLC